MSHLGVQQVPKGHISCRRSQIPLKGTRRGPRLTLGRWRLLDRPRAAIAASYFPIGFNLKKSEMTARIMQEGVARLTCRLAMHIAVRGAFHIEGLE